MLSTKSISSHVKASKKHVVFLGKNLQDDSVEICVRVDSVEIFFVFDFVA